MTGAPDQHPPLHVDASFLIQALVSGSAQADVLSRWLASGRGVAMSTLAWSELLCDLTDPQDRALARRIVREHVPVNLEDSEEAARLYEATGRRTGSLTDCIAAACAIAAESPLATAEPGEFRGMREFGLQMGV